MGNCVRRFLAVKNEEKQIDLPPLPNTYSNDEMKNQLDTTWIRTKAQANAEFGDIKNRYFYPSDDWSIKKNTKRPNPNVHARQWRKANLEYRKKIQLRRTHSLFFDDRHYTPFPHRSDNLVPERLDVIDDAEAYFRRY